MASEVKLVIWLKDNQGFVGLQAPECDPRLYPVQGDIVSVAAELPALLQRAEQEWSQSPKNPKSTYVHPPAPVYTPSAGGKTKVAAAPEKASPRATPTRRSVPPTRICGPTRWL